MLHLIEHTCPTPQENLAFDDELLKREEEVLRLWEAPAPFVVLGRSGLIEQEVDEEACAREGVPVLRRSSGGGTVLQAPGCLNYALILSLSERPYLMNIEQSYPAILGSVIRALDLPGLEVRCTDILFEGRKVSGNSQRRTRGWVLHHGTLLYKSMDLDAIARVLREPLRQPRHRKNRSHTEFLTRLPIDREWLLQRLPSINVRREQPQSGCP